MSYFVYVLLLFGVISCEGEILVNDQKIYLTVPERNVIAYDQVGIYNYVDGELAKFTCLRNRTYNYHEFIFNISDAKHETRTGNDSLVNLYLKLSHKGSPKHIDCTMGRYFKKPEIHNIRLFLKPLTTEIEYPQFKVNGLSLRPSKDSDHNYVFFYEYYPGEELKVLSNLNPNKYKSMSCKGERIEPDEISKLNLTLRTPFITQNASLDCLVKVAQGLFTTKTDDVRIVINFIEDSMKFSPYITGIQWSKIIAKFYNIPPDKQKIGTFYVSYSSNDNTALHCSHKTNNVIWKYGDKVNSTLLTVTKTDNEPTNYYTTSRIFQLYKNVSETTLKCENDNETSIVVLIKQKEKIKPDSQENTENSNNETDDEANTTNNYESKSSDIGKHFLLIIIIVIPIIIILLIITLIACIYKRKKLPKTVTDINYENLPAHNEGVMPIPPQWDTNTNHFKNENIEDIYAKVIPKSQRATLADIYSEPKMEETCYATPYEPTPKPQRNGNIPREPGNVDYNKYAKTVPKALGNVTRNKVMPTNTDYVENGTKMRNRVDTDKHKYANICNSEVYANVCSSGC